jgi:hypothetical protein
VTDRVLFAGVLLLTACPHPKPAAPAAGDAPKVACTVDSKAAGSCDYFPTGLPAVTPDGKTVVIGVIGEDGARGAPNFRLSERRVADDVEEKSLVVETPDQTLSPEQRQAKLDEANRALAGRGLLPLTPYPLPCEGDGKMCDEPDVPVFAAGPYQVEFVEPKLTIRRDGAVVLERDESAWSVKPHTVGEGEDAIACTNPAGLATVWADLDRGVLLLLVHYHGTDTCWEPDSEYHVLALPK